MRTYSEPIVAANISQPSATCTTIVALFRAPALRLVERHATGSASGSSWWRQGPSKSRISFWPMILRVTCRSACDSPRIRARLFFAILEPTVKVRTVVTSAQTSGDIGRPVNTARKEHAKGTIRHQRFPIDSPSTAVFPLVSLSNPCDLSGGSAPNTVSARSTHLVDDDHGPAGICEYRKECRGRGRKEVR